MAGRTSNQANYCKIQALSLTTGVLGKLIILSPPTPTPSSQLQDEVSWEQGDNLKPISLLCRSGEGVQRQG